MFYKNKKAGFILFCIELKRQTERVFLPPAVAGRYLSARVSFDLAFRPLLQIENTIQSKIRLIMQISGISMNTASHSGDT